MKTFLLVLGLVFFCGCTSQTKQTKNVLSRNNVINDPLIKKCDTCGCKNGIFYGSNGKPVMFDGIYLTCKMIK